MRDSITVSYDLDGDCWIAEYDQVRLEAPTRGLAWYYALQPWVSGLTRKYVGNQSDLYREQVIDYVDRALLRKCLGDLPVSLTLGFFLNFIAWRVCDARRRLHFRGDSGGWTHRLHVSVEDTFEERIALGREGGRVHSREPMPPALITAGPDDEAVELERLVTGIPDGQLRQTARLLLAGAHLREIGVSLGCSAATVYARVTQLRQLLAPLLRAERT